MKKNSSRSSDIWSGSVGVSKNPIVVSSCRCKADVIRPFREVFSSHSFDIGKCKKYEFSIKCPHNVSLSLSSRRIPLHLQNKVDEMIDKLLENDIIELSHSPFNSP